MMAIKRFARGMSGRGKSERRLQKRKLLLESLENRLLLCGVDCYDNPDFDYVGNWKQYHKDSGKIGKGTAELIADKWAITAWHVAKFKANNPNGGATEIRFPGVSAYVTEVYKAPGVDIALVKLNKHVPKNSPRVTPVSLFRYTWHPNDGVIPFTLIGHSGGLHKCRIQGRSQGTSFKVVGDSCGKAGDSGGAWVKERYGNLPDVQFAVLHGGGTSPQIGPIADWIDSKVGEGVVNWVTLKELKNGLPTDTHTWTGNDRLNRWESKGNWNMGGTPGQQGTLSELGTNNHETARLRWMGAQSSKCGVHANPRVQNHWSLGRIEILATKDHNVTVNGASSWNLEDGSNRKTVRLNGTDGQAFMVHADPDGSFVSKLAAGIRVEQLEDLQWSVDGDETLLIEGRVNGNGKIIKTGSGTLKLGNVADTVTNNGTNPLEIQAGQVILAKKPGSSAIQGDVLIGGADAVLTLEQEEQIADTAILTVNDGQFNLNDKTETVSSLVLVNGMLQSGLLISGTAGFQLESGLITSDLAGDGGLTKNTPGDVTLAGDAAYFGPTQIHDGKLHVNGAMISDVSVDGGWLVGTGAITGDVDVMTDGSISAGDNVGVMTIVGDVTLAGSLLVEFENSEQGTIADSLDITGAASLTGKLQLEMPDDVALKVGDAFKIVSTTDGITGELDLESLPDPPLRTQWRVEYADGAATLRLVPTVLALDIVDSEISERDGYTMATVSREDSVGEITVQILSDDLSEVAVPASVVIADGELISAPFRVTAVDDTLLDGTQTVTITASADNFFAGTDTIDVTDYETVTIAIDADAISENAGAAATTATITRSNTDNEAALMVALVSSDTTEATAPTSVTIPADQAFASFPIDAIDDKLLDGTQTVTITGSALAYFGRTDTVEVIDYETVTIVIDGDAIAENAGAAATTATIIRSNTDVGEPLEVTLSSSDTSEAAVPASVLIPASQTSVSFPIDAIDDKLLDGTQTVTISGSATDYFDVTDTVDVIDHETITIVIDADSISENAGVAATTATITRSNTDDQETVTVTLFSSDTTEAAVPTSVMVPASQASVSFPIDAIDDTSLDGTQTVAITGTASGFFEGADTVDVIDHETVTIAIDADTISENAGEGATTATVTRSNATDNLTLIVTLFSSDTTEATVPASVTIPANQTSVRFSIDAIDDALLDGRQTVAISGSASEFVAGTDSVDVIDHETITIVIDADAITENEGAGATTATIIRSNTDDNEILTVRLSSSDTTEAAVAESLTIPADQASLSFPIDAIDDALLDGTQTVAINGSALGFFEGTDTVEVIDHETVIITIDTDLIAENAGTGATTATITRSNTDHDEPLVVTLSISDSSEVSVPSSMIIPAGQAATSFSIDAIDDATLDGTQTVYLNAMAADYESTTNSINVGDYEPLALAVDVDDLMEMTRTQATVTRGNTDDSDPVVVSISGGGGKVELPETVMIPANEVSVSFEVEALYGGEEGGDHSMTIFATAVGFIDGDDPLRVTENPNPWQNPNNRYNVNNDPFNHVSPYDIILPIDKMGKEGSSALARPATVPTIFYDVSGDNYLTPLDALLVIYFIDQRGGSGEGEAVANRGPVSPIESQSFERSSPAEGESAFEKARVDSIISPCVSGLNIRTGFDDQTTSLFGVDGYCDGQDLESTVELIVDDVLSAWETDQV